MITMILYASLKQKRGIPMRPEKIIVGSRETARCCIAAATSASRSFRRSAPFPPALADQFCLMVMPRPSAVNRPNPEDWYRPLYCSRGLSALIEGELVAVDLCTNPSNWSARGNTPPYGCVAGRGAVLARQRPARKAGQSLHGGSRASPEAGEGTSK